MIHSGKHRVTEDLLYRALAYISHEELAKLTGQTPEVELATINDLIRANALFRERLLSYLDRYLGDYVHSAGNKWVVSEEDIEEPIRTKRLEDRSEQTIKDEACYIRHAPAELNCFLSLDGASE